jgi:hypothetical protein
MILTAYLAKVRNFPVANEPMPWSERVKALVDGHHPNDDTGYHARWHPGRHLPRPKPLQLEPDMP